MPHDLAWFDNLPDAGEPDCICSYCGGQIEENTPALRIWDKVKGLEARLCEICREVIEPYWIKKRTL